MSSLLFLGDSCGVGKFIGTLGKTGSSGNDGMFAEEEGPASGNTFARGCGLGLMKF